MMSWKKNKFDENAIKNLTQTKATKSYFKRQPKLERQKTYAELQAGKAKSYLWTIFFAIIFVVIASCLAHYYLVPYWKNNVSLNSLKTENGWTHFLAEIKAFFLVNKDLGATMAIVFIVLSVIGVSGVIIGCLYWFWRCFCNIFKFGRNWFFWLFLTLFAWLPLINVFVLIFALKKYKWYAQAAIANQTNLATANTVNYLANQQVPQTAPQTAPQIPQQKQINI